MDTLIRIMEAVAKLAGAIAWPAVALTVLWWFGASIRQFLSGVSEGSFKAFGIEGSAKRIVQQAIISADLSKSQAMEAKSKTLEQIDAAVGKSLTAAEVAAGLVDQAIQSRDLLWVDDRPSNNELEKRALEALGFTVQQVTDTESAIRHVKGHRYDVIVSDMARPGDEEAGKTLLRKLREMGDETPFIVYSSSDSRVLDSQLADAGAYASTHLASELIVKVTEVANPPKVPSEFRRRVREMRSRYDHIRPSS